MTDTTNEWIDLTSFKSGNSQALRLKKELLDAAPAFSTGATMRLVSDSAGIIVASSGNPTEEKERDPLIDAMLDTATHGHLLPATSAAETQQRTGVIEKSHKLDNVCYDIRGPVLKEAKRSRRRQQNP